MPVVTRRELLEAGVHFGHQTRRWNPKMQRFLYGERSGIYIIDLEKSLEGLEQAHAFVRDLAARNGVVLFIGTKKQAHEPIHEHAGRSGMPFVTMRWLGGMLTNFQTVSKRLIRLRELREMDRTDAFDSLPKKEVIRLRHEMAKLERNLGGIQDLERLPDAVFIIDTKKEHIAITEARKLGLPVIAIVDTNCDPDEVDYAIPGNDDAIRAVNLVTRVIADAIVEGRQEGRERAITKATGPEIEPEVAATPDAAKPAEPETVPAAAAPKAPAPPKKAKPAPSKSPTAVKSAQPLPKPAAKPAAKPEAKPEATVPASDPAESVVGAPATEEPPA